MAVPRGLRLHGRAGRPGLGDVDRGRGRARRARRRAAGGSGLVGATAALASALLLLPTFVSRARGLVAVPGAAREPAHARPRPIRSGRPCRQAMSCLLRSRVELPHRRVRAGVHLQRTPGACRRHEAQPPLRSRAQWRRFNRTGELGIPKRCGAAWLVIDRSRFSTRPDLAALYRDGRFIVFRVPRSAVALTTAENEPPVPSPG